MSLASISTQLLRKIAIRGIGQRPTLWIMIGSYNMPLIHGETV